MKPKTINQEILLFTNTSFAKRELCEKDDADRNETKNPSAEQLEKACWSGSLFEMLPGVFNRNDQKNNYVWNVNHAEQFIIVSLGNAPGSVEHGTSIDPYFFLQLSVYNN